MKFFSAAATATVLHCTSAVVLGQPLSSSSFSSSLSSGISSKRQGGDADTSIPLRIMPLGASITWGTASEDGNGYRKFLYDSLTEQGFESIDMVGSQQSGDMEDRDNEGHPGYKIAEVSSAADVSIGPSQPNLVLINAGTNDCIQNDNVDEAADPRMRDLLDKLFTEIPGTTVVLSTLLVNVDEEVNARVDIVNDGFRGLVEELRGNGQRIVLAEMNDGGEYITLDDLVDDGIHPNAEGYKKMAARWLESINAAFDEGFVQTPNEI